MLENIELYLTVGFFGALIGIFIARRYFRRTILDATLGKIIEVSLIEKDIKNLESQIQILNNTIISLKEIGESLEEQVRNSQDIERSYSDKLDNKDKTEIKDI